MPLILAIIKMDEYRERLDALRKEQGPRGAQKLFERARREQIPVTLADVKRYLASLPGSERVEELFRPIEVKGKAFSRGLNSEWKVDLIDYSNKVKAGPKYILICINSFSREAFGTALDSKTSVATAAALSELLGRHPRPEKISTDMGQEFGAEFSRLLDREDIDHGIKDSRDHTSYAVMERAIPTIKKLLAYKR